jgi:hypothetical protein
VGDALQSLLGNPQPLLDTLAEYPSTLIHADYRTGNLALWPDTSQVVAFDWQDASYAPATLCLSWFIMSGELFLIQDAAAEYYRVQLAKRLGDQFEPNLWQPMLAVGCLTEVLRKGNWHALFAVTHEDEEFRNHMRRSVGSYNDLVRRGLKWL